MAFRIEKAARAFVVLLLTVNGAEAAEQVTISVRHTHIRKGGAGSLGIGGSTLSFRETRKKRNHSREWAYDDIQQLYVAPNVIRVLTYEDVSWKLGKDREYEFDQLPEGAAQRVLDGLRGRIDARRVVAAMSDPSIKPLWQIKAKLTEGRGGSEGVVLVGEDSIVYKSAERDESRTWQFRQIDNISSSGPFDLTITTFEQAGSRFAGRRDFRFQLKTELAEEQYNALWRRLNESRLSQSSMNYQLKENEMTKLTLAVASISVALAADAPKTYTGIITDSMCVMNHKMMNITSDSKCVRECVKNSKEVKYVLHDGKNTYKLSDQKTPEQFAAQKVKVTGTLFPKTGVIKVDKIEASK